MDRLAIRAWEGLRDAGLDEHHEWGNWAGGGVEIPDCNLTMRTLITNGFNSFINASCLNCFPGLKNLPADK